MEGCIVLISLFFLSFFYFAWNTGFVFMVFMMLCWFITIFFYHVSITPLSEEIGYLRGRSDSLGDINNTIELLVRKVKQDRKRKHGKK